MVQDTAYGRTLSLNLLTRADFSTNTNFEKYRLQQTVSISHHSKVCGKQIVFHQFNKQNKTLINKLINAQASWHALYCPMRIIYFLLSIVYYILSYVYCLLSPVLFILSKYHSYSNILVQFRIFSDMFVTIRLFRKVSDLARGWRYQQRLW